MKNSLFLADFLLIREALCPKYLEQAISALCDYKEDASQENSYRYMETIDELCDCMGDGSDHHIHFEDYDHQWNSIDCVVRMCWDIDHHATTYIITPLHKIPSQSKL